MLYPNLNPKKKTDYLDDAVNDEHDPVLQFVMSYPILQHFPPKKILLKHVIQKTCYWLF